MVTNMSSKLENLRVYASEVVHQIEILQRQLGVIKVISILENRGLQKYLGINSIVQQILPHW